MKFLDSSTSASNSESEASDSENIYYSTRETCNEPVDKVNEVLNETSLRLNIGNGSLTFYVPVKVTDPQFLAISILKLSH